MVNSVLNGACIDLCVAGNWSRVSFGSYLQCDLPGWDDPEGASYIWKERQATQRGFKISGDVFFLTSRFTGLPAHGSFWSPSSQKPPTSCIPCGVSLMFCDCKNAQGGIIDSDPSLLRLQPLTHTQQPHPCSPTIKNKPSSPCDESCHGGGQVKALWQLLASLEPPDPSSPPEWVLPLPNTVGERTTSVWRAGLGLRAMFRASMATNDIWDGTTQIDRIHSSSSRLSSHRQTNVFSKQLRVSLVPYWHYTWLLKRGETKQKCASAKMGEEDGRTPTGLKQIGM